MLILTGNIGQRFTIISVPMQLNMPVVTGYCWMLHTPKGGMLKDGKSLIDFNSFPMRIRAIPGNIKAGEAQQGELRVNHLDGIYGKSLGCITPSGWTCKSLPYLVELDNYGKEDPVNVADTTSYFPWGWDEIIMVCQTTRNLQERMALVRMELDQTGRSERTHESPAYVVFVVLMKHKNTYRANTRSKACPLGITRKKQSKRFGFPTLRIHLNSR